MSAKTKLQPNVLLCCRVRGFVYSGVSPECLLPYVPAVSPALCCLCTHAVVLATNVLCKPVLDTILLATKTNTWFVAEMFIVLV